MTWKTIKITRVYRTFNKKLYELHYVFPSKKAAVKAAETLKLDYPYVTNYRIIPASKRVRKIDKRIQYYVYATYKGIENNLRIQNSYTYLSDYFG